MEEVICNILKWQTLYSDLCITLFFFLLLIFFLFVVNSVIHWNEKALGSHVFKDQ